MADISVNGWIAEGGGRLVHTPEGDVILFDVIENEYPCDGFEDEYGTNKAWFHCCFHIKVLDLERVGVVPEGCEIFFVFTSGVCTLTSSGFFNMLSKSPILPCEEVVKFITEGKLINLHGQELLLKGEDGKIMRTVIVSDIWFKSYWVPEKPHILKVPYKSDWYIILDEDKDKAQKDTTQNEI